MQKVIGSRENIPIMIYTKEQINKLVKEAEEKGRQNGVDIAVVEVKRRMFAAIAKVLKEAYSFGERRISSCLNDVSEEAIDILLSYKEPEKVLGSCGIVANWDTKDGRYFHKKSDDVGYVVSVIRKRDNERYRKCKEAHICTRCRHERAIEGQNWCVQCREKCRLYKAKSKRLNVEEKE